MPPLISQNYGYAIFAGVALALFIGLAFLLSRSRNGAKLPGAIWVLLAAILVGGWWRVEDAGEKQRQHIARIVSAMAPTYAREMARNGHAQLTLETPPDDPVYRRLLQMQREWIVDNPGAHDIYTMRRLADGRTVFMVDADTDYDGDGIVTDSERGAELGREYEVPDAGLDRAFQGEANFDFEPITDQWGTWVGAWAPVYDAAGRTEAVLGIDFDARRWFAAIGAARRERFLQLAFLLALVGAAGWAIGALRADVARRRPVEEGLRQAQERWNLTIEQMPLALIEWGQNGEILAWNPEAERIFGHPKADVLGSMVMDLIVPPSARRGFDQVWHSLLAQTGGRRHLNENVTRDGRTITCEWFNAPVMDRQGRVVSILSLAQDITQRLNLEQQMRQSQKMQAIGLLAAGIAHDFNNILTIIQGHAELLLGQKDLPALGREDAERIATAAERAADLTRQLLTFSRRQAMFARPIQLNDAMAAAAGMLGRVLGANIALRCELSPNLPPIEADPSMLDQIVTNLAVNSRDAMPRGGVLTLATRLVEFPADAATRNPKARPGPAVCLHVSDTGCGIPADKLPHIFEPFFTTKEVGKGTGLGLAAVHGIVEQHRGWIEVSSEVGRGTTVEIFLPPGVHAVEAETPSSPYSLPVPAAECLTVLVVEDDHTVRALVRKTLERGGYHVLVAVDGPSAQAVWIREQHRIDVLFTDMMMPNGLSGREIAEMFLSDRPDLRVVYASGYSAEVALPGFLESETQMFLQKPFLPTELLTALGQFLGVNPDWNAEQK